MFHWLPILIRVSTKLPLTLLHVCSRTTHRHLTLFSTWPFFDLWPLISRSDKEVTVDSFASSSMTNTLTLLLLSFDTFCNLTFFTFDPLSVGRTKRSPWTLSHLRPRLTHWPVYFCHLKHFVIWPFFDLWPLNRRSDKEVTVDTYACLPNTNTLTLLLLSFQVVCNLTSFFDPCETKWSLIDLWL